MNVTSVEARGWETRIRNELQAVLGAYDAFARARVSRVSFRRPTVEDFGVGPMLVIPAADGVETSSGMPVYAYATSPTLNMSLMGGDKDAIWRVGIDYESKQVEVEFPPDASPSALARALRGFVAVMDASPVQSYRG